MVICVKISEVELIRLGDLLVEILRTEIGSRDQIVYIGIERENLGGNIQASVPQGAGRFRASQAVAP